MAISYIGGVVGNKAGATSGNTSVALDSGLTGGVGGSLQEGDLVLVVFVTSSTADRTLAITDPSAAAYSLVASELYANGTTNDTNLRFAYKFMGSTPDTSLNIGPTGNAADGGAWAVYVLRGVDPDYPFDVTPTTATGTGTSRPNPPSITPITTGALVVVASGGGSGTGTTAFTFASSSNLIQDNGADTQDGRAALAQYTWTSGALDPAAAGAGSNNAADSWAAVTAALRPYTAYTGPVIESATWGESGGASSVAVNKPVGVVNGSLMIAAYRHFNGTALPSLPSGWSWGPTLTGTAFGTLAWAWKKAGGSEPSSYTWNAGAQSPGDSYVGVTIFHISGADDTDPFDADSEFNNGTGTSRTNPGITTSVDQELLIMFIDGFEPYGTIPVGWSAVPDQGDAYVTFLRSKKQLAGVTGSFAISQSPSQIWMTYLVGIKPATAPTPGYAFPPIDYMRAAMRPLIVR